MKKKTPENSRIAKKNPKRLEAKSSSPLSVVAVDHGVKPNSYLGFHEEREQIGYVNKNGYERTVVGKAERVRTTIGKDGERRKTYELLKQSPSYMPDAARDVTVFLTDPVTGHRIRVTGIRIKPNATANVKAAVKSKPQTATAIDAKPAPTPPEPRTPRSKSRERTVAELARDLQALRVKRDAGFDPPVNIKTACALWDRSVSAVRSDVRRGLIPAPIKIGCRDYFPCSLVVSRMTGKPLGATTKGIDYLDRPFG